MVVEAVMEEPRDHNALVLTGGPGEPQVVYARRDNVSPGDPNRWWPLVGDDTGPVTWDMVTHELVHTDDGEQLWVPRQLTRLYRSDELDEAIAAGGYEQIGPHRIALGSGICVEHGEHYAVPHELDLLRRNTAEGGEAQ